MTRKKTHSIFIRSRIFSFLSLSLVYHFHAAATTVTPCLLLPKLNFAYLVIKCEMCEMVHFNGEQISYPFEIGGARVLRLFQQNRLSKINVCRKKRPRRTSRWASAARVIFWVWEIVNCPTEVIFIWIINTYLFRI